MATKEITAVDQRLIEASEALRKAEERSTSGMLALETIHEIRNPLEALGHLTYLTFEEADDPKSVRRYMLLAKEQMDLLREIASETLGFARTSRTPVPTKAAALGRAALRIHQRTIESKGIHLVTDVCPHATAQVRPSELLQVLSNLITNALDALPSGGTMQLRIKKFEDKVHFLVADSGSGIPPQDQERVFEPFFSTKDAAGTGLGLALSKKIVEGHGGTIRVRSSIREGKSGTIFRVCIPMSAPAEVSRHPPMPE